MGKLRVNDEVVVLSGKDKGKVGKIKKLYKKSERVLVDGVNTLKKHVRPNQANPEGGIVAVEKSVHQSNVAIISPKTKKPTKIKFEFRDGKKVRVAKACGTVL